PCVVRVRRSWFAVPRAAFAVRCSTFTVPRERRTTHDERKERRTPNPERRTSPPLSSQRSENRIDLRVGVREGAVRSDHEIGTGGFCVGRPLRLETSSRILFGETALEQPRH